MMVNFCPVIQQRPNRKGFIASWNGSRAKRSNFMDEFIVTYVILHYTYYPEADCR